MVPCTCRSRSAVLAAINCATYTLLHARLLLPLLYLLSIASYLQAWLLQLALSLLFDSAALISFTALQPGLLAAYLGLYIPTSPLIRATSCPGMALFAAPYLCLSRRALWPHTKRWAPWFGTASPSRSAYSLERFLRHIYHNCGWFLFGSAVLGAPLSSSPSWRCDVQILAVNVGSNRR